MSDPTQWTRAQGVAYASAEPAPDGLTVYSADAEAWGRARLTAWLDEYGCEGMQPATANRQALYAYDESTFDAVATDEAGTERWRGRAIFAVSLSLVSLGPDAHAKRVDRAGRSAGPAKAKRHKRPAAPAAGKPTTGKRAR